MSNGFVTVLLLYDLIKLIGKASSISLRSISTAPHQGKVYVLKSAPSRTSMENRTLFTNSAAKAVRLWRKAQGKRPGYLVWKAYDSTLR